MVGDLLAACRSAGHPAGDGSLQSPGYQLAEEQAVQQNAVDLCLSVGASSTDVALRWLEQAERS